MYLTPQELNTSMYSHILNEITEGDNQVIVQAIEAAIEELSSYLANRYDTELIFNMRGKERNALILENTKVVTIWQVIKLSNAETIYEIWKERYDRVIDYMEKVAEGKASPRLPLIKNEEGEVVITSRYGSNPKFNHSI